MRYSKSRNAGIGHLNSTLGTRNIIWTFLFHFSFVSSASWLVLWGVMSARCQAAIALLRIVFSCDGWLQCAILISRIRIICLHEFFFVSWASSRVKDDCYVGFTHHSLQDNLKSTVHSMFTVPNVFGVWQQMCCQQDELLLNWNIFHFPYFATYAALSLSSSNQTSPYGTMNIYSLPADHTPSSLKCLRRSICFRELDSNSVWENCE